MRKIVFSGHQPNFIPYMGFFYKMFKSDIFVIDDDVQFSKGGWHNYNYIKVGKDRHRITVPVSFKHGDLINEVIIDYTRNWQMKMLKTLKMNYSKAMFFDEVYEFFSWHILSSPMCLVDLNVKMLIEIKERFGIETKVLIASKDIPTDKKNNDRNVFQCLKVGSNIYYSGIGGKEYNDLLLYKKNGIKVVYTDYKPVEYKQQKWNFIPNLSVLDYLFNEGFKLPKEWEK